MNTFVKHEACPNCGSSDALARYDDGHAYCFSCEYREPAAVEMESSRPSEIKVETITPKPSKYNDLADRRISAKVAEKYGVTCFTSDKDTVKHIFPYEDSAGIHIANKFRMRAGKIFRTEGQFSEAGLFGQSLFPPNSKLAITVTEGEYDAMSVFQMNGMKYPVVSLKSGAQGARKDVEKAFEYLDGFKEIVLCFDKDEAKVHPKTGQLYYPGQEAAERVARMFKPGKVRIVTLQEFKDANDYLVNGKTQQFQKEWWDAPTYTPTGLKVTKNMWDEISDPPEYETAPYPWEGLNSKTYGMRLSELVVVTAETGVGKTSILKEIEYHLLKNSDKNLGLMHLEESNTDTALGLMSIEANAPLHLPDTRERVSKEELRKYFDNSINNDRVVIWDHFGSNSIEEVLSKVRHMHNMGAKFIVLDHLSIVVSDQSGDERKQLDEITTKLKTLCMELNIALLCVIHLNRGGLIRGSAGVEQLANIVIRLERDKNDSDEWRRNVTKVSLEKNRFCGRTGPACYLHYDNDTGRLGELGQEEVQTFEAGRTVDLEESWS